MRTTESSGACGRASASRARSHKPHLRWDFPREFLDNIPEDVPEAVHQAYPADKPDIAWHECAEMSVSFYDTDGNGSPPLQGKYNKKWQSIVRRAYYACISYVDSLIGDALDALETNGVAEDTVVSFIGDVRSFVAIAPASQRAIEQRAYLTYLTVVAV